MADSSIAGGVVDHSIGWGGEGKIYGVVRYAGESSADPVRRRIDLYGHSDFGQTGVLLRSTFSQSDTGYYEFLWLRRLEGVYNYRVVLRDWPPSSTVREAKIADWVQPAPM